jgi:DNA replication protein DnaC
MLKFSPEVSKQLKDLRQRIVEDHEECKGSGYVPTEVQGQVCRCDCMILFRYLKELVKSKIPRLPYWILSLENLQIDKSVKNFSKMYVKNIHRAVDGGLGALLYGPNGVGKTSVMIEIGKEAIVNGYSVRYFTLASYIDSVFQKNSELVDEYESGDVLLIDELDKASSNRAVTRTTEEFLRKMSNLGKSMILATNWDKAEIAEELGQSTYSLLKRSCKVLAVDGGDYSDILEDEWTKNLTGDYDYWHESLMSMAQKMEESSWQK